MKLKIAWSTILIAGLFSCTNQSSKIILEATGYSDSTVIYLSDVEKEVILDTGYIINNSLEFNLEVDEPTQLTIRPIIKRREDIDYKYFWKESQEVNIKAQKGNLKYAKVTGGEMQNQSNLMEAAKNELLLKRDSVEKLFWTLTRDDEARLTELNQLSKEIRKSIQSVEIEFIKKNPNFLYCAYNLQYLKHKVSKDELKELFEGLNEDIKNSRYGEHISKYIQLSKKFEIGDLAVDFELPNLDGNMVSLESFKGKFVLLEFWGSGCGPCRMENPNLLKNYRKYKDEGFEIVSVSLDKDRKSWEDAVKKDSMIWTTVADLKGFAGDVPIIYSVYYVPTNYLLNPEGEIIAKDLRRDALGMKLENVFSQN